VIARLWDAKFRRELTVNLTGKTRGHVIEYRGEYYPIFYRPVTGYGKTPIIVGGYVRPGSSQVAELQRLTYASIAAGIVLLLVVAMALVLGRQISRPVRELATAARRIGELDFSHEVSFKNTRLREFIDAAGAFNSMMAGLRWFETYVPRTLARRIIRDGGDAGIESGEHDVTVMFTDIVRFTGLAENLSAIQTAELLNQHFSLLAGCIEAEEGTLDKFIGDSVMAFWAPPVNPGDHVVRACRAALAIREVLARDNRARAERGEEPIRVRIGIHTGRAIVGNIGAPGRINYTVVGDTVNIAQRLEELGKTTWGAGEDAIILVSGTIAAALGEDFDLTARGSQEIRGREGRLRVFRLEAGHSTEMAQGQEPKSEPDRPEKLPEPAEPPEPPERPERPAPRDRDQTTRAYNPSIVPPAPHAAVVMGIKPSVETKPPAAENPADSRPAVAPRIAPPGSPAPNRRAGKDPVGYKFDWELDAIKADLRKDKDRPDETKS
jgi:adenylate cyclase